MSRKKARKVYKERARPEVYAGHLARLSLSQIACGEIFGVSPRTSQRWAADGPPIAVTVVMGQVKSADDLEQLVESYRHE